MPPAKARKKSSKPARPAEVPHDGGQMPPRMSLARRAYEYVKEGLLEGRYHAGERLNIDRISEDLAVSRFPVMEALKQLEAEQLVLITPQVGCSVIKPSLREISDHFRFMARAEGFIIELAADRGNKADLDNLAFISAQIGLLLAPGMPPAQIERLYRKLNRDFHDAIHRMAAAPELTHNVAKLFDRNDFFIAVVGGGQIFAERLAASHREHQTIIKALAARDGSAARAAIEQHIMNYSDLLTANLQPHQT